MRARHTRSFALWIVSIVASGLAQSSTINGHDHNVCRSSSTAQFNGASATTQAIDYPASAIPDGLGGFYVASASQNRIYRVALDGTLTIVAGTGEEGYAGDGGPATAAKLNHPWGTTLDASGNLFFAESGNNIVRKVTAAGIISTVAGTGRQGSVETEVRPLRRNSMNRAV
jgi:hypothetical protein